NSVVIAIYSLSLHDALPIYVVRAEVQCDLSKRQAHHDPVGLDVRDVVEQQPRHRDHLQVVRAARLLPTASLEDRVLRMERERDEDRKSTRLNSSHQIISYAV